MGFSVLQNMHIGSGEDSSENSRVSSQLTFGQIVCTQVAEVIVAADEGQDV